MPEPIARDRCPLCGDDNTCALAAGSPEPCWCTRARLPPELLERVPPAARGRACVCAACAASYRAKST